jgi:hypothetical protein
MGPVHQTPARLCCGGYRRGMIAERAEEIKDYSFLHPQCNEKLTFRAKKIRPPGFQCPGTSSHRTPPKVHHGDLSLMNSP